MQKQCWVITDGRAGNENPALGLAEAVARLVPHSIKPIRIKRPPRIIDKIIPGAAEKLAEASGLSAPWPDLVIGCGAASASLVAWIRSQGQVSDHPSFAVQLLKPPLPLHNYDLVIAPEHDQLTGRNVISSFGSLSRVTDASLAGARQLFPQFAAGPGQMNITVLIGGSTRRRKMSEENVGQLFDRLEDMCKQRSIQLLVSISRRSGPIIEALVRRRLETLPAIYWDGTGNNPYMAFLAHADALIVTGDSINMVSDAASTSRPVYVHDVSGLPEKFSRFHTSLMERGVTQQFTGSLENRAYSPLREADRIAEIIVTEQKKCRATRTRQV